MEPQSLSSVPPDQLVPPVSVTPPVQPEQPIISQPQVIQPYQTVQPSQGVTPDAPQAPITDVMPMQPGPTPTPAFNTQPATPVTPTYPSMQPQPLYDTSAPTGQATDPFNNVATQPLKPMKQNLVRIGVVAGGLIVLGGLLFGAYTLFGNKPITFQDITSATNTVSSLDSDITNADLALSDMTSTTNTKTLSTDISNLNSNISDAQKQFDILKKSPVLGDSSTDAKFNAVENKWGPFITYLQNTSSDYKVLGPIVVQFTNNLQNLSNNPPTTDAQLATYLANFKNFITIAESQIKNVKMKVSTDQQTVTALSSYLQSISSSVSGAQSALSNGQDIDTVYNDLSQVATDETTYENSIQSITNAANAQQSKLDPSNQINAFTSALATLASKVKS